MSKPRPLTPRQRQIVDFIRSRRVPPTYREIMVETGIRSPNGVACHLTALERKGAITRERYKHRRVIVPGPHGRRLPPDGELLATLQAAKSVIGTYAGTDCELFRDLEREIKKLCARN